MRAAVQRRHAVVSAGVAGRPSLPVRPDSDPSLEHSLAVLATRAQSRDANGLRALVQIRVTDNNAAKWYFDLTQAGCRLASGTADGAVLTITANSRTWLDLASKRLSFAG